MNTGAHTRVDVGLPPREATLAELTDRATKIAVKEALKLWTERDKTDQVEPGPRTARRPTLTVIVLTTVIVLLLGWTAYREYASYADKEAETEDRILSALEAIRGDQIRMQGAINKLYDLMPGVIAQPQTVEPLVDAISHGTASSN